MYSANYPIGVGYNPLTVSVYVQDTNNSQPIPPPGSSLRITDALQLRITDNGNNRITD